MTTRQPDLADIPGTVVFDGTQCRLGYHLNMWCMTLQSAENRAEFQRDEDAYLRKHRLAPAQCEAIRQRDYNRLLALGGNIYFLSKIAAVDGHSFQQIAASMSGVTVEAFQAMMLAGGRAPQPRADAAEGR